MSANVKVSMSELLEAQRSLGHLETSERGGGISSEEKQVQKEGGSKVAGQTKSVRSNSQNGSVRTEHVPEVEFSGHVTKEGGGRSEGSAAKNGELAGSDSEDGGGKTLTAASIRPVLEKRLSYLTGGVEDDVHPIVTIPDVGLRQLETLSSFDDLQTTFSYFKTLIGEDKLSTGVTFLLDARSSKTHPGAKQLLERLSDHPPFPVHIVYVFMKTSFFSRTKNLAPPNLANRLHLAYLHDSKSLFEQLEASNVTMEMGGTLQYSHENWVHNRVQFEKMIMLHEHALKRLPEALQELNKLDVPETVREAEDLMQSGLKVKESVVNLTAEAEVSIDRFLEELRKQTPEDSIQISPATKDHITMMSLLNGMMEELKVKQAEFDQFWGLHKARVDHMVRMCHFNRTAEKLRRLMQGHVDDLTSSDIVIGDTLESALELGEKHEAFVTKCIETMDEHMSLIRQDAQTLLHPTFDPQEDEQNMHAATRKAIETVRGQMQGLTQTYQQLVTTCQQKRDLFIVCVRFHMTVRQCQQWNQDVLEFLASQPLEEPSQQAAVALLSHIDAFLEQTSSSQIVTMTELANTLPGKQFKKMSQKTASKAEQTRGLLETRKASLLKILANSYLPPPKPPGAAPPKAAELSNSLEQDGPEAGGKDEPWAGGKDGPGAGSNGGSKDGDSELVKGRRFIFKELVATESDYIRDVKTLIDSYYDEMDPDNLSVPLRLRGKRDIIFGNLLEIYMFHDTVFSKALQQYADHPERIGECFIQHGTEFQMYSAYCKNRTNSETLINESTESQAFFKGIQLKLAHALPLNAYLIKPIQRITKYQLLLKDMMKHCMSMKETHEDLQNALDRMLKVLKNLNDSLHVVGLKGFPGALAEQGRLLAHDAFQVWESAGRTRFARGRERHVFLFEKVIVLSKKVEVNVQRRNRKTDTYIYKDHLQMAEIGLRERIDCHPLQFEITVHGQHKAFKFQAQAAEIKTMWSSEIRRLLQAQFTLMKDVVIKSGTLDRRSYRGKAKLSTRIQSGRLFGDSIKMRGPNPKKSLADKLKLLRSRKSSDIPGPNPRPPAKKTISAASDITASLPVGVTRVKGKFSRSTENLLNVSQEDQKSISSDGRSDSFSSDDEFTFYSDEEDGLGSIAVDHYESLAPGAPRYYIATSDYSPGSEENGVPLTEGREVEVLGINPYGWWWVRSSNFFTNEVEEGWVPASYLRTSPVQFIPPSR